MPRWHREVSCIPSHIGQLSLLLSYRSCLEGSRSSASAWPFYVHIHVSFLLYIQGMLLHQRVYRNTNELGSKPIFNL